MKIKTLICPCALMVCLSGVVQAHQEVNNEGKFTILFGGGSYFTDSGRDLNDGHVTEIGLGYIINKHWAVEAIYSEINSIESEITRADVDADMYRIDALYHFDQRAGHWTPYLAAGIGELNFDTKAGKNSDETAVNFGGGIKYALSKAASLRDDVRAVFGDEDSDLNTLASLGVTYIFGAQAAAVPSDSDGDGVLNRNDQCPNTKQGRVVDSDGCPRMATESVSIDLEVLFDTNKAEVKPAFMTQIQRVADFMASYPKSTAVIEGHTDSRGDAAYNQGLSQRRADAVRTALVEDLDIDANRVTAKGYGEEKPRASNDTLDGRQQNRRGVAVLKAQITPAK